MNQMNRPRSQFQYQEIASELRQEISRGDFMPDGRLPSERILGQRFGVQRNTIRRALSLLESDGHITTEDKRGSFVRGPHRSPEGRSLLINLHDNSSPSLTQLVNGFTFAAMRAGFSVRRTDTHPPDGAALDPVPSRETLPTDAAGIALWPQNPTNARALSTLNHALPLVLVDRRVLGVSADCVRFDDIAGGRAITEHLIGQGHRRIGFVTDEVFADTVQQRWQGYAEALEAAHIAVDPTLTMFFSGIHEPFFSMSMKHVLTHGDVPSAIVCSNDVVAFMLLRFLRDAGFRVPHDIAVTGYGNSMPDYTEAMALTSVDQPFFEMGRAAAHILIERIGQTDKDRLAHPRDVTIPVSLVARSSSNRSIEEVSAARSLHT